MNSETFYRYSIIASIVIVWLILWYDKEENYIPYQETATYSDSPPDKYDSYNIIYPGYIKKYSPEAILHSYRNCPWTGIGCKDRDSKDTI